MSRNPVDGKHDGNGHSHRDSKDKRSTATQPRQSTAKATVKDKRSSAAPKELPTRPAPRDKRAAPQEKPSTKQKAQSSAPSRSHSLGVLKLRITYRKNRFKHMIEMDKKRQASLQRALSRLRQSKMMDNPEEIEMDFMNVFSIDAFGDLNNYRVYVDIELGDQDRGITNHEVMFDTASAITWVRKSAYVDARTPQQRQQLRPPAGQREPVQLAYTSRPNLNLTGELYQDKLRLGSSPSVRNQLFAVIDNVPDDITEQVSDGIFACGPRRLSRGVLMNRPNATIDTVLDNLVKQQAISALIVGLAFNPINDADPDAAGQALIKGTIHIGGTRSPEPLRRIPATLISPSRSFVGVDLTLSLDGLSTPIINNEPGIIDAGSSFIYLARDSFNTYMNHLGARYDQTVEAWYIRTAEKNKLRNLHFHFEGGVDLEFPPSAQVWPPTMNKRLHDQAHSDALYFTIRELSQAVQGRTFILGMAWIIRYYVGIDRSNPSGAWVEIGYTPHTRRKWIGL